MRSMAKHAAHVPISENPTKRHRNSATLFRSAHIGLRTCAKARAELGTAVEHNAPQLPDRADESNEWYY